MVAATRYHWLLVHPSRASQVPEWFEVEGFEPAIDPQPGRLMIVGKELPGDGPTARVLFEVNDLPDVRVAVRLAVATGELVAIEVGDSDVISGSASAVPKPISARLLRRVPFGEIESAARLLLKWELAVRHHHEAPEVRAMLGDGGRQLRESLAEARRPGRRGRNDAPYASLAAEYVKRLASTTTPVKDLALEMHFSDHRIRNMLAEARRRGLLTRPPSGKSGGQLTEKAVALLAQKED